MTIGSTKSRVRRCIGSIVTALLLVAPGVLGEEILSQFSQTGVASWYGASFRGKRTASGELFNPDALTAAHRSLPFGHTICVFNLSNGRRVQLRVNDRGPWNRRILDVSEEAARQLGMLERGVVRVRITTESCDQLDSWRQRRNGNRVHFRV